MARTDCHLLLRSLTGPDDECGDTGFIRCGEAECFIALVDVLGHGPEAHAVAVEAEAFLAGNSGEPLVELMQGLHRHLRGSRGAVASLCRLDLAAGNLCFTGIGNITCRIFGAQNQRLVSRDGIVGYMMSQPAQQELQLAPRDVVMLYSDGVREHFEAHDLPGLLTGSAREIVERVMGSFAKGDDDASCLVMRYLA